MKVTMAIVGMNMQAWKPNIQKTIASLPQFSSAKQISLKVSSSCVWYFAKDISMMEWPTLDVLSMRKENRKMMK